LQALTEGEAPVILVDRRFEGMNAHFVGVDDELGRTHGDRTPDRARLPPDCGDHSRVEHCPEPTGRLPAGTRFQPALITILNWC
jgi:hypothetical protein